MLIVWYKLKGMGDEFPEVRDNRGNVVRKFKPAGMLQITQADIAKGTGLCEDTVRIHNEKLVRLGWLKIVEGNQYGRCPECSDLVLKGSAACKACGVKISGKLRIVASDPDKIIDLTSKLLDREMCVAEYERFMRIREHLRDQHHASQAERIHQDLLKAWEGKEHSLKAFWREVLRLYASAGIPQEIREALIPIYRE
jgi:transcription initiation factor TFIIIB Brf1 subunit/transcription initiation factor TFIIB